MTFKFLLMITIGYFVLKGYHSWLTQSDAFQMRKIEITGNDFISDEEIIELAEMNGKTDLWEIDLVNVEKKIRENRLVEDVYIHRRIPDILEIHIQEKQALALLKVDDQLFAIDPAGFILPSKPGKMYNMPVLSGAFTGPVRVGSDIHATPVVHGLVFLKQVLQDRPELYNEISEVVAGAEASLNVYLSENGVPVYFGSTDYALKIRSLEALIREPGYARNLKQVRYVDLRYRGQVILGVRT